MDKQGRVNEDKYCGKRQEKIVMTFEIDGQTWQAIDVCKNGVIAVLVVDGRKTNRKGYFPYLLPGKSF